VWALDAALREVVFLLSRSTCLRRSCMVMGWSSNMTREWVFGQSPSWFV
jgi:hypothetical protein